MLKNLPLYFFTILLTVALPAIANQVIIKGTIKYSNGNPAANRAVYIMPDTVAVKSCNIQHIVYTNADGFYSDSLVCNEVIIN